MALPLPILHGLRMPLRKNFGLAFLFSSVVLNTAFDISRTILKIFGIGAFSPSIGRLLNSPKLELAVTVSPLMSYVALLGK